MLDELRQKKNKIAVIGLGYVGLPLALEFARVYDVIGYDINAERVAMMAEGEDPSRELDSSAFEGCSITFTDRAEDLRDAHFYIVAVPTPIDEHKTPNLSPLFGASEVVGRVIGRGDYVIFESTVYPGCTEEDCVPIIEKLSGLKGGEDFSYGYSPERINPGDKEHTVCTIIKVVSGDQPSSAEVIEAVYASIITAGVFRASSVKVAEAAKVIENTQRDLNIAFMNELSMIFDRMDIDTKGVLEAASTKWNFLRFYPGLVGGHCIGVDPYYLTYKAQKIGYLPEVILSGRRINDGVPSFLAKRLVQMMIQADLHLKGARVLVLGITFKENVSDIRNSKVADLIKELQTYALNVDIIDPFAEATEVQREYQLELCAQPQGLYEAVLMAVAHDEYSALSSAEVCQWLTPQGILMDIKGIYDGVPEGYTYWRM
jgi:UDP-N-acetyl-D-glucosamine/UDP-N-acetyl-D-galactosamine dehydrogenase